MLQKACKKLVGVYKKLTKNLLHLQASVHEIYVPPIQHSDWSEFTSYGTNIDIHLLKLIEVL